MIVIVLILVAIYYIVLHNSPVNRVGKRSPWRTWQVSILLGLSVFTYAYFQANNPPDVNYWKIGWTGYMRALNAELELQGSPHRMVIPGQ